jgi:hypothetical protein
MKRQYCTFFKDTAHNDTIVALTRSEKLQKSLKESFTGLDMPTNQQVNRFLVDTVLLLARQIEQQVLGLWDCALRSTVRQPIMRAVFL